MHKLVTSLDEALAGIRRLNSSLESDARLRDRLGQAHAYYVLEEPSGERLFGFSKFVGYEQITPEKYLRDYKNLNGRNTEHALKKWFEEVRPGSASYDELYQELSDWLARFGKRPRGGESQQVRIMIVRPDFRSPKDDGAEDRRLLDLLVAVADMLPTKQRHELRAAL